MAQFSIALKDPDETFNQIEKAYEQRSTDLIWIKMRPSFDPIRADSRYKDICRKIGFPK
jgi:hypothetical protein